MSRLSLTVVVERKLLESKAYRDLDGKAAKVLMWFLAKRRFARLKGSDRQEWMQTNNGEIIFTYEEAFKKYGYSAQVFSKLLDHLLSNGFIDIATQGTGIGKAATKYAISTRWEKYGTNEFEEVKRVKRATYKFPKGKDHPVHRKQQNRQSDKSNYGRSYLSRQ